MTIRPALRPRRDRVRDRGPRVNVPDTAPASSQNEGSSRLANFGAQSHGFWSRCLRLVVVVSHHCTQDSLPAAGPSSAGRDSNPQGFYERFLSIWARPPFPSFHGARFVHALFFACRSHSLTVWVYRFPPSKWCQPLPPSDSASSAQPSHRSEYSL